jgi:hypothetical protein
MPKVRSSSGEKWARRAGAATQDYTAGVQNPRVDWAAATTAAADNQAKAIQQAIAEKRFQKGVQAAGTGKWASKAVSKGAARFAPGVAEAAGDYEKAVAPYLSVIESTQLPPRGPKGDPANIQRVAVLAAALNKKKRGM